MDARTVRKSVSLAPELWRAIGSFRPCFRSEAEAFRQVVRLDLALPDAASRPRKPRAGQAS
jgi:hypothetical protein